VSKRWKIESGNWTRFRELPGKQKELDFHRSGETREKPYETVMAEIKDEVLDALKEAQESRLTWVLFTHGWSTSQGWKHTTARSVIRGIMRSPAATSFIVRRECIQHDSVFVARIRSRSQDAKNQTSSRLVAADSATNHCGT
jgi:hypothetical protein